MNTRNKRTFTAWSTINDIKTKIRSKYTLDDFLMSVLVLLREFGICLNRHEFQKNLIVSSGLLWILINESNMEPKLPLH